MKQPTKFTKGTNPGTVKCANCGKRVWASRIECDLCPECYEEAGMENAHQDGHHKEAPEPNCYLCQREGAQP